MAGSRRSRPADGALRRDVRAAVLDLLARALPHGGCVAVALSGGRDSVALLDAATRVATQARIALAAFHVHHGLSPHADRWALFCRATCEAYGISLTVREVRIVRRPRESVEAAARNARLEALAVLAREHAVQAVLLAHHADDQAETMLLQLLRGAGPHGLAAMPDIASSHGVRWLRPFLGISRQAIDGYIGDHGLAYIDDESNVDARYRRNALRLHVAPALRALSPGYPQTLVRACGHQAEAAVLLDALAELDARGARDGATLACATLRSLDAPRARNLLRWFLRENGLRVPSTARLAEMLAQVASPRDDARVAIAHDDAELGVHRGRLVVHAAPPTPFRMAWAGDPSVTLPHGTLTFIPARGAGIARHRLERAAVTIRAGVAGERLRVRDVRRPVADLLREAGVPAWERNGLPRLYCDDALVAVPHAGIDAAFAAQGDELAVELRWQAAPMSTRVV